MRCMIYTVLLACALLLTGCAGTETESGELPTVPQRLESGIPAPGVTRDSNGQVTAVGTVVYRRDQGGFFAVADIEPGELPSADPRIVAIIVNEAGGRDLSELSTLVGAYCGFTGTLHAETATDTPSPEIAYVTYRVYEGVPR